jgi:hypothetical protein
MNDQTTDPHADKTKSTAENHLRTDEADVSVLAHRKDPSLTRPDKQGAADGARRPAGVEWVRPSDLITRGGSKVAGRGIDFQAELARRSRCGIVQAGRATGRGVTRAGHAVSERARRLPPASAFGRGGGERFSWVSRSGIGLG